MTLTIPQAARRFRPGETRRRLAATEQELRVLRGDLAAAVAAAEQARMDRAHIEALTEGILAAFRYADRPLPEGLEDSDQKQPVLRLVD
jgi:hypothetical protein